MANEATGGRQISAEQLQLAIEQGLDSHRRVALGVEVGVEAETVGEADKSSCALFGIEVWRQLA